MKWIALIVVLARLAVASAADTKTVDYIERLETPITFVQIHGESLKFEQPVWFSPVQRLQNVSMILEHQTGKAWLLHRDAEGERKTLFADWGKAVSDGPWEGLMCVAFHPDFPSNRRFFVKHETLLDGKRHTVVVEKRASEDWLTDSGEVSRQLVAIAQPADNHNGGTLAFGPDGFLYIAMGDGGPQEDPQGFSQSGRSFLGGSMSTTSLLAKLTEFQKTTLSSTAIRGIGIMRYGPWVLESLGVSALIVKRAIFG